MLKIADAAAQGLEWSQPKVMWREYELRASGELVATLQFRSLFGTLATGESGDGCWTLKRVGFFQQRATIRRCDSETEVALFTNNTWTQGGTLECANGGRFLATTNLWSTRFDFTTEAEEPLVKLHYGGVFRLKADVEILPAARSLPELPIIVLAGWYLAVMLYTEAAAAASS